MTASKPPRRVRFGQTYSLEQIKVLVLADLQGARRRLSNGQIQNRKPLKRFTTGDISAALRSLRDKHLVTMHGEGSRATWSVTELGLAALAASRVDQPGPRTHAYWACPPEER